MYVPLILTILAVSPSAGGTPKLAEGLTYRCDFGPPADRNFDGWPDGWTRRRGPGMPDYVRVAIADDAELPADAGRALRIELDGGGAQVHTPPVAIDRQFSFLATARLRTAGLHEDSAVLSLVFLDEAGLPLATHSAPPITGTNPWREIQIGPVSISDPRATRAQLVLRVAPRGDREDLNGTVALAEVRLRQLPRMTLRADQPTHVYVGIDPATVRCEVSGIELTRAAIRFELLDWRGARLAATEVPLIGSISGGGAFTGTATWHLPPGDFGWYEVRAVLVGEQPVELTRTVSLARMRPLPPSPRSEFGWTLRSEREPLPAAELSRLLGQSGARWVKLPVWYDPADGARGDEIASFAEQLSLQGIEMVGILDQPPAELRAAFREPGRLPVASVLIEPALWKPTVSPALTRLSLKVRWWQLGDDADASYLGFPDLPAKIGEIKQQLEEFGQEVRLGIGWRWHYAPPEAPAPPWSYLSYAADPPFTADELAAYLGGPAAAPSATPRWIVQPPLPASQYSLPTRVRDLVGRMLAAKIHGAAAVFVPEPFHEDRGLMNADGTPGPLFLPWRTTARLIGGTEYLGQLTLPGGSINQVFAQGDSAVMVIWNDQPTREHLSLGTPVELLDAWGRSLPIAATAGEGPPGQAIEVGPLPTFVTGLSAPVLRWQIALGFANPRLASVFGREQSLGLVLQNSFGQGLGGELTLVPPRSWSHDSRPLRFKLNDGESLTLPIAFALQPDANSGPQPVRLDFELAAGQNYRFSVYRTLQLGLDDVQIELATRLREDGSLLVEQRLTNLADQPVSFQCTLFPPGRRRETRQVINQERGQNVLTFVLPDGAALLGQKLWLRAEEISGERVLNSTVTAER
ncbi:MAG: hypothetical protein SFU86_11040 [Pirellulaceae bacterium]|nr:hypothetical protein [Pirellulaceae bacterium]